MALCIGSSAPFEQSMCPGACQDELARLHAQIDGLHKRATQCESLLAQKSAPQVFQHPRQSHSLPIPDRLPGHSHWQARPPQRRSSTNTSVNTSTGSLLWNSDFDWLSAELSSQDAWAEASTNTSACVANVTIGSTRICAYIDRGGASELAYAYDQQARWKIAQAVVPFESDFACADPTHPAIVAKLNGKIAIVSAKGCGIDVKIEHARAAGARAVILVHETVQASDRTGGSCKFETDPTMKVEQDALKRISLWPLIPVLIVTSKDGAKLRSKLESTAVVTISAGDAPFFNSGQTNT